MSSTRVGRAASGPGAGLVDDAGRDALIDRAMDAIVRLQEHLQASSSTGWMQLDLTLPQVKVLMVLGARGDTRMSDLGQALGASASTATGIVDRLHERGLVERSRDAADRRAVRVGLTPQGEHTLAQIAALTNTRMRQILTRLSPGDLATVISAMDLLTAAALEEFPPMPATPAPLGDT